jgi:hypothetical protein
MEFHDRLEISDAPRLTRDGYLVASVKAARTGIQLYSGREVDPDNALGLRDMATVRVYRAEAEVFNKDTLRSFAAIPVTLDHPPESVTADNWQKYGRGETDSEVLRDGEALRVGITVRDASAVRAVEGGKRELSMGYMCDVVPESGTTEDGLSYDAKQINLRGNHLAIVGLARGGHELKIGDSQVTLKTITVDGHQVEVSDAAAIAIAGLTSKLATADAALTKAATDLADRDTKIVTLTTEGATKDAQIVTLTKQVADAAITPAKLRDAAKAYGRTVGIAKKLGVPVTDAMDEPAIHKAVVLAKVGDAAKDWTADQCATSFATLSAGVTVDADPIADSFATQPIGDAADKATNDARAEYLTWLKTGTDTQQKAN